MKSYSLGDIASRLNLRLIGDPDCQIQGLGTLASANTGDISHLKRSNALNWARWLNQIPFYINLLAAILAALSAPRIISRDAAGSQGVFDNTTSITAGIC